MAPMPPPKPTTEGPRDRQVVHEMGQLVRALKTNGPVSQEELGRLVGADYWETGRYDRAVSFAAADGLVYRSDDGMLKAT